MAKENKERKSFLYYVIYAGLWCIGILYGPISRLISFLMGRLVYYCFPKYRHIVQENLEVAFSDKSKKERIKIAKKTFANLVSLIFEIGCSLRLTEKKIHKYFQVEGFEYLVSALEKKRGAFLLTGHIGNWELLPVVSYLMPVPGNVLYRPLDFTPLDEFFVVSRSRNNVKLFSREGALRKVVSHLRQNEVVLVLQDQNVDWYEGVFVDFFGKKACTSVGMATMAYRLKTPIVPMFLLRTKKGFLFKMMSEVEQVFTDDARKDIEENTQRYNDVLEEIIRQYPDQWFWVHRRWKTAPCQPWPRREG